MWGVEPRRLRPRPVPVIGPYYRAQKPLAGWRITPDRLHPHPSFCSPFERLLHTSLLYSALNTSFLLYVNSYSLVWRRPYPGAADQGAVQATPPTCFLCRRHFGPCTQSTPPASRATKVASQRAARTKVSLSPEQVEERPASSDPSFERKSGKELAELLRTRRS